MMLLAPLVVQQPSFAQAGSTAAGPSGPIDIQANEQEFAEGQVIAKGNVRVKYKDSVVFAPLAQLYRDASGNPQRAVFTGHPRLTQGANKIDAETLIFEIANSKVIAQGNAHSEVVETGDSKQAGTKPASGTAGANATAAKSADARDDVDGNATADATARGATSQSNGGSVSTTTNKQTAPEKIITDSDRQEYDRSTGKFEATGHVRVVHGNIRVKADKLQLVYGTDNKPETALFIGNVAATQDRNTTMADQMVYSLTTRRLQATGHVKSTVIQERKPDKKKSSIGFDPVGMQAANAADLPQPQDDVVVITSDAQDYSKDSNRMSANGNVHVYYQDMVGAGPTVILLRNAQNKAERIIFSGRSQISQPGKRWIADHIEMTVADKKVLASGNTKALILQTPAKPAPPAVQFAAGRNSAISASKVDLTK
jgi:lipopolysaccharide export system protein LptA